MGHRHLWCVAHFILLLKMNDQGIQGTGSRFNSRFEAGSPILAKQLNDLAAGVQASLPMPYLGEGSSVSYLPGGSIITSQSNLSLSSSGVSQFQINLFSAPSSDGRSTDWFVQIAKGMVITDTLVSAAGPPAANPSNGLINDTALKTGVFETESVAVYPTGSNFDGTDSSSVWCNSGGKFKLPAAAIGTFTPPIFFFIFRNVYAPTSGISGVPTGQGVGWPYLALIQESSDADTRTKPFISPAGDTLYDDSLYYIQNASVINQPVNIIVPGEDPIVLNLTEVNIGPTDQHLFNYNCQRILIGFVSWDSVNGNWTVTQKCLGSISIPLALSCKYTVFSTSSFTTAPLYADKQDAWYTSYSGYGSNYIDATREFAVD